MLNVPKSKVYFFFNGKKISIQNRSRLKWFIEKIFISEGFKIKSLNYIFCSDRELLKLNQDFLGHNYYTDIITFDLSENKAVKEGEIYISVERVKENAENLRITFKKELLRVIIHGVLHLCGYTDKTIKQRKAMREREDYYLRKFLYPGFT
jgi:probable rRNA maturation factor